MALMVMVTTMCLQVGKLHPSKPEEDAKQDLIKQLDDYLEVQRSCIPQSSHPSIGTVR